MSVRFERPCEAVLKAIADNLRPADANEVMLSGGYTPWGAVKLSVDASEFSAVVVVNDEACGVMGLMKGSAATGTGIPWLLGTPTLGRHGKALMLYTPVVIKEMLDVCPYLVNYVHVENTQSIRWLKAMGFQFDPPAPYGVAQEPFQRFTMEAAHV